VCLRGANFPHTRLKFRLSQDFLLARGKGVVQVGELQATESITMPGCCSCRQPCLAGFQEWQRAASLRTRKRYHSIIDFSIIVAYQTYSIAGGQSRPALADCVGSSFRWYRPRLDVALHTHLQAGAHRQWIPHHWPSCWCRASKTFLQIRSANQGTPTLPDF
jgi:hypothetical protein